MIKRIVIDNWADWVEVCDKACVDPQETCDFNEDLGGGDVRTTEYVGEYPEKESENND